MWGAAGGWAMAHSNIWLRGRAHNALGSTNDWLIVFYNSDGVKLKFIWQRVNVWQIGSRAFVAFIKLSVTSQPLTYAYC